MSMNEVEGMKKGADSTGKVMFIKYKTKVACSISCIQ